MTKPIRLTAVIFVLAAVASLSAQRPADVVKWSVNDGRRSVKAGAAVSIGLTADVAPGWHLYALNQPKGGPNPLSITIAKGKPFEVRTRQIVAPAPAVVKDGNFDLDTRQYDGRVVFTVPIAPTTAPAGTHAVPIEVTFQACGNGICLRPFTQTLPIQLEVVK